MDPAPMAVYDNTPSGEIRRAVASGAFAINGDAAKLVQAMIASVDTTPVPSRLAALKAQQDIAHKDIAHSANSSTSFPQA